MIRQLVPKEAARAVESEPNAVYLDVRTEQEFAAGHPAGAVNVPVVFLDAARQPSPNPDFEEVVQASFSKDQPLVIGCQSGVRSMRAAGILESLGYTNLANVVGGFGGSKDASGTPVPGWKQAGLPVGEGTPAGRSYESLKARVS